MTESREHFFIQKTKEDKILDEPVVRRLSYEPQQLGLPTDKERVEILEHTIPLEQNTAILRVAEYLPTTLIEKSDDTQPGITLIVFGGGASPGPGTNVKLAVEAEQAFIRQHNKGKKAPNIRRILIVSHPTGAPREKEHVDQGNYAHSAQLAKAALSELGVNDGTNTIIMGFSLGGTMAVELAASYEKDKVKKGTTSITDLVLIEPAGTAEYSPLKLQYHFTLGNFLGSFRRYRELGNSRMESLRLAQRETRVAWATMDGVPSWLQLAQDFAAPQDRHMPYARAYGLEKPAKFGPDVGVASSNSIEQAQAQIKGRVLIVQMENAHVVNNPISAMLNKDQFTNARERTGSFILGAEAHSFAMVDDGQMMDEIAQWLSSTPEDSVNPATSPTVSLTPIASEYLAV